MGHLSRVHTRRMGERMNTVARIVAGAGTSKRGSRQRPSDLGEGEGPGRAKRVRGHIYLAIVIALGIVVLVVVGGGPAFVSSTISGLTMGSYLALGAVGLTLLFGTLHLVNFAHGDMMTAGAYVALLVNVGLHASMLIAGLAALIAMALVGGLFEIALWRPLRKRHAGNLQLLLVGIGLAYVIRNVVQLIAGSDPQVLRLDVTSTWVLPGGVRVGKAELAVLAVGFLIVLIVASMIRYSTMGKQMRAMADNRTLAEVTGLNTRRITLLTWLLAGGLAGLAGILAASASGQIDPNFGFQLLLYLFVALVLGGLGNAYGALAGGIALGLVEEWSTLVLDPKWKISVGFAALILVVLLRPNGMFGRPTLK